MHTFTCTVVVVGGGGGVVVVVVVVVVLNLIIHSTKTHFICFSDISALSTQPIFGYYPVQFVPAKATEILSFFECI